MVAETQRTKNFSARARWLEAGATGGAAFWSNPL